MKIHLNLYLNKFNIIQLGIWAGRGVLNKDDFLVCRNSADWKNLGINFFASGIGVWILWAVPEVKSLTITSIFFL